MKRFLDFSLSLIGLTLLLPALAWISVAIRITSGRPVFFSQARIGRHGQEFVLKKFRTMKVLPGTERGSFELGDRSRLTLIGRFLRAAKLDELPQLWNVLKGEMSLVGPRPEVRSWVSVHPDRWTTVLSVRPGITDPASLLFRNEEDVLARSSNPETTYRENILPRKLSIYETYVQTHTLGGDLRLILLTLWKVAGDILRRKG